MVLYYGEKSIFTMDLFFRFFFLFFSFIHSFIILLYTPLWGDYMFHVLQLDIIVWFLHRWWWMRYTLTYIDIYRELVYDDDDDHFYNLWT